MCNSRALLWQSDPKDHGGAEGPRESKDLDDKQEVLDASDSGGHGSAVVHYEEPDILTTTSSPGSLAPQGTFSAIATLRKNDLSPLRSSAAALFARDRLRHCRNTFEIQPICKDAPENPEHGGAEGPRLGR